MTAMTDAPRIAARCTPARIVIDAAPIVTQYVGVNPSGVTPYRTTLRPTRTTAAAYRKQPTAHATNASNASRWDASPASGCSIAAATATDCDATAQTNHEPRSEERRVGQRAPRWVVGVAW